MTAATFRREDTEFTADDGTVLRGWLYRPDGPGPHSAISMAHGYAGTRHHGLEPFAEALESERLVTVPGSHVDPSLAGSPTASRAARAWFADHLQQKE